MSIKTVFKKSRFTYLEKERELSTNILFLPSNSICIELHQLAEKLRFLTQSYGYIVYMTDFESNELFILSKEWRTFYSKRYSWPLDECHTIAGYAARKRTPIIVRSFEPDINYYKMQDISVLNPSDIMSIPICDSRENCFGVIELYRDNYTKYSPDELKFCSFLIKWCAETLYQNDRAVFYKRYNSINVRLCLELQKDLAEENLVYGKSFLNTILTITKKYLGSDSVTIYLEKRKVIKREISTEDSLQFKCKEDRIKKELKICKMAVALNTELNIFDVFDDTRFDHEVDIISGRLLRSVLTSIFSREKHTVGVIQVNNKIDGNYFVRIDTFILKLFKRYLSIWSHNEDLRADKNFHQAMNNYVFLPILNYQFDRGLNKIKDIKMDNIQISSSFHSFEGETNYTECPEKLLNLMIYTFITIHEEFNENQKILRNFLYMVRQTYWNTPTMKFEYAFDTFRLVSCVIRNYPNLYNTYEKIAILISALCRNINSRNFPDIFFLKSHSPIHEIQNHHPNTLQNCYVTKFLVEKSGILKMFTPDQKHEIMNVLEYTFISTSYTQITTICKQLNVIYNSRKIDLKKTAHKEMLTSILLAGAAFTKFPKNGIYKDEIMHRNYKFAEKSYRTPSQIELFTQATEKEFFREVVVYTLKVLSKYMPIFKGYYHQVREMAIDYFGEPEVEISYDDL